MTAPKQVVTVDTDGNVIDTGVGRRPRYRGPTQESAPGENRRKYEKGVVSILKTIADAVTGDSDDDIENARKAIEKHYKETP